MRKGLFIALLLVAPLVAGAGLAPLDDDGFTDEFGIEDCKFKSKGDNAFFLLRPGTELFYAGEEDGEEIELLIQVLHETRKVHGVKTRVIKETEWVDGELLEESWNYFAECRENGGVFYFGEDVNIYEGDEVSHEGAWLAGVDGALPGLIMTGLPLLGSRYYQEVAPEVALDRAEHLSRSETVETPAGIFENCLLVEETTPLEPDELSYKWYAPGVGLVKDGPVMLLWFHIP